MKKLWPWLVLAALVIIADQTTKTLIQARFQPGDSLVVTRFFSLVLVFNAGAAFSFLSQATGWQRPFFIGVAIAASALIIYLLRKHPDDRWFSVGLALILGGALGNLWDRVALGHVVDFLLFHYAGYHWPAFNVADSAITVGAVMLVVDALRADRKGDAEHV